jgi:hypothetical protein
MALLIKVISRVQKTEFAQMETEAMEISRAKADADEFVAGLPGWGGGDMVIIEQGSRVLTSRKLGDHDSEGRPIWFVGAVCG